MAKATENEVEKAPAGDGAAPVGESKGAKFARIAARRTDNTLVAIASLGGLTAKNNYDYTENQWQQIFNAINAELTKLAEKVKSGGATASEGGFSFAAEPVSDEADKA